MSVALSLLLLANCKLNRCAMIGCVDLGLLYIPSYDKESWTIEVMENIICDTRCYPGLLPPYSLSLFQSLWNKLKNTVHKAYSTRRKTRKPTLKLCLKECKRCTKWQASGKICIGFYRGRLHIFWYHSFVPLASCHFYHDDANLSVCLSCDCSLNVYVK